MFKYRRYNAIFHLFSIALEEVAEIVDDLLVTQVLEGLFAGKRQDLPQSDRKGPNVALAAEFALKKAKPQSLAASSKFILVMEDLC